MIAIPKFEKSEDLHTYLRDNKSRLIDQKKSMLKHTSPLTYSPTGVSVTKSNEPNNEDVDSFTVKVVANAAMVLDSDMDVLITGCYDKTVEERKSITPHLHDHIHKIEAKVGEVKNIYTQDVLLSDLGISKDGYVECLLFETEIIKAYNEQIFNQYKSGKINQHSIGLNYVDIELAVNDSGVEKELFEEYIGQIVNPEKAIKLGYFWVVKEITLIENSAVLFGSNHATPTLDNNIKIDGGFAISGKDLAMVLEPENTKETDTEKSPVVKLRLIQQQLNINSKKS